jgi:hypothetical protein
VALLVIGVSALASAVPAAPEIDPGTGVNVLALLAGAAIVVRASLRK